jgi:ankyrin repeat protein
MFHHQEALYDALLEAISSGRIHLALSLLAIGIDPSLSEHGGRLAKVSGRIARRKLFKSNPLHLGCMQGEPVLVKALLALGYSCKSPDASGSFPIHHVCLKSAEASLLEVTSSDPHDEVEGNKRSLCLQYLLEHGKVPITIKDGNKQTILHCVARTGNPALAKFVIDLWRRGGESGEVPTTYGAEYGGIWDWRDRWYRTPVQWAVLNGHLATLRLLLEAGCAPCPPPSRRPNRSTSAETETPLEICTRVYLQSSDETKRRMGVDILEALNASYHATPLQVTE